MIFDKFAIWICHLENHKYSSDYAKSVIWKAVPISVYSSLQTMMYVSFTKDLETLRAELYEKVYWLSLFNSIDVIFPL
jgi:hypothetical protein